MMYDPNGGTLHDLAAVLTRYAVESDNIVNNYDIVCVVVDSANQEYGKKVNPRDLAHDALFDFPLSFNRVEIQRNMDRIVRYYS